MTKTRNRPGRGLYDVVVVRAGRAGSVLAWDLARRGVKTLLLDRSNFPREKVCGDYVEPRGLHLIDTMGCLKILEKDHPLPSTLSATYVNSVCRYRGPIPFYGLGRKFPPHGYIIPRHRLDHELEKTARKAGVLLLEGTSVTRVTTEADGVTVETRRGRTTEKFRGRLVVGADGTGSIVAEHARLLTKDPRHIALWRRRVGRALVPEASRSVPPSCRSRAGGGSRRGRRRGTTTRLASSTTALTAFTPSPPSPRWSSSAAPIFSSNYPFEVEESPK